MPEGETVLMTASRTGNVEAMRLLLAHGADPNAQERWLGETALMWAAAENHASAVKLLLEAGATVGSARQEDGVRPQGRRPDDAAGGRDDAADVCGARRRARRRSGADRGRRQTRRAGSGRDHRDDPGDHQRPLRRGGAADREGRQPQRRRFGRHDGAVCGRGHEHAAVHARAAVSQAVGQARYRGLRQRGDRARRRPRTRS